MAEAKELKCKMREMEIRMKEADQLRARVAAGVDAEVVAAKQAVEQAKVICLPLFLMYSRYFHTFCCPLFAPFYYHIVIRVCAWDVAAGLSKDTEPRVPPQTRHL